MLSGLYRKSEGAVAGCRPASDGFCVFAAGGFSNPELPQKHTFNHQIQPESKILSLCFSLTSLSDLHTHDYVYLVCEHNSFSFYLQTSRGTAAVYVEGCSILETFSLAT